MKKLKVLTVVGTRPEIIRLSRVMAALDASEAIEHITVHTGQNYDYELNEIFYQDLGIRKPDYFLNAAGANASATIGQILINIDPILEEVQPDAFLVLGDTNSCLCAIPAKKRHIPIFHMEAGNRCFDQRVPEETNRKIVDHIADINLTYSSIAREYLLREGLPADNVIKTGSPMFEVLNHYMPKILASDVLTRLGLQKEKYFVASAHREENINNDKNFSGLITSLNLIAEKYGYPIIVSTHPRTRKKLEELVAQSNTEENAELHRGRSTPSDSVPYSEELSATEEGTQPSTEAHEDNDKTSGGSVPYFEELSAIKERTQPSTDAHEDNDKTPSDSVPYSEERSATKTFIHPLIQWMKPLGFSDYNALQLNAYAVLSDSGTISEESSIMNFRALNIREAHERPEAMEEASVMMVGLNPARILQGLQQLQNQKTGEARNFFPVADYSMPNVSDKVVRIILSYTDYVKRTVWSE